MNPLANDNTQDETEQSNTSHEKKRVRIEWRREREDSRYLI